MVRRKMNEYNPPERPEPSLPNPSRGQSSGSMDKWLDGTYPAAIMVGVIWTAAAALILGGVYALIKWLVT